MLHILRFFLSSRCRLFHNAMFFGSSNIIILNTGCAKILKKIPVNRNCEWDPIQYQTNVIRAFRVLTKFKCKGPE